MLPLFLYKRVEVREKEGSVILQCIDTRHATGYHGFINPCKLSRFDHILGCAGLIADQTGGIHR